MTFLSLQLRSTKIVRWRYPGGKVCVTGCHVTSRNQGLSSNDQGRQRKETLGTRLIFKLTNTMRPALHVVRFKHNVFNANRFHPSVEQIYRWTERNFPTVQINSSHIHSTIPSSNGGARQDKITLKSIALDLVLTARKLTTTRGLPYGIPQ